MNVIRHNYFVPAGVGRAEVVAKARACAERTGAAVAVHDHAHGARCTPETCRLTSDRP